MIQKSPICCGQEMTQILTRMDRMGVLFPDWYRSGWYCFKCRAWRQARGREKLLKTEKNENIFGPNS